ncbi:MAG: transposase, partial [Deltaproteobacteria bacterium]|nr:transposase [Deltaproteobacteria bacterium]
MTVPESIRRVERPVNTIVDDYGRDGPFRYAVRERAGTKYVPGGNPQPNNGRVIGHIIGFEFVPKVEKTAASGPEMLSYGSAALVRSVTQDILSDLLAIYPANDVFKIMSIATLRVIRPSISARRMSAHYNRTFVCVDYPGTALSADTIGTFLQRLGQDVGKRKKFYEKRIEMVAEDHHIAIDGTLKQDTSIVNDLSAFSYKARLKGCQDISVLYAYDIELMEPICAQVFPGNCIDASSYPTFIRDNNIRKGIIVADKGFPPTKIEGLLKERPELHFLTPIKRNDKRIAENSMLEFDEILEGIIDRKIVFKKCPIGGGRFLYSFKDNKRAAAEEAGFLANAEKKHNLDKAKYSGKKETFGVIVFECDQDLPGKTVYQCYDDRWMLELVFARYKNDECLDKTNVQGDFSVIGSEFINFISTIATCRILRKARSVDLLAGMSYGELMDDLSSAWRVKDAPEPPSSNDVYWVHTLLCVFDELEALGLSAPATKSIPKKMGRPKKNSVEQTPKRPRGRP